MKESRLLYKTLADINAQRAKVGAAAVQPNDSRPQTATWNVPTQSYVTTTALGNTVKPNTSGVGTTSAQANALQQGINVLQNKSNTSAYTSQSYIDRDPNSPTYGQDTRATYDRQLTDSRDPNRGYINTQSFDKTGTLSPYRIPDPYQSNIDALKNQLNEVRFRNYAPIEGLTDEASREQWSVERNNQEKIVRDQLAAAEQAKRDYDAREAGKATAAGAKSATQLQTEGAQTPTSQTSAQPLTQYVDSNGIVREPTGQDVNGNMTYSEGGSTQILTPQTVPAPQKGTVAASSPAQAPVQPTTPTAQPNAPSPQTPAGSQAAETPMAPQETPLPPATQKKMAVSTLAGQMLANALTDAGFKDADILVNGLIDQQNKDVASLGSVSDPTNPNTAYGSAYNAAETNNKILQGLISQWKSEYTDQKNQFQSILDKTKEDSLSYISQQQASQQQQLAWNAAKQTRDLSIQKQKLIDQEIGSLALRGGYGSTGGFHEIAMASQQFDNAISDLQTQTAFKQVDVAQFYTNEHNKIINQYTLDNFNAQKEFTAQIQNLNSQSLSSESARIQAQADALKALVTGRATAHKEAANQITDLTTKLQDQIAKEKANSRLEKDSALSTLISAMKDYPAGSSMRQFAINNASALGIDTSGIDIDDKSIDEIAKLEKKAQEDLYDLTPYLGDKKKFGLMSSAMAVSLNSAKDEKTKNAVYKRLKALVDSGKDDMAVSEMKNLAESQMPSNMRTKYSIRNNIVGRSLDLLSALDKIDKGSETDKLIEALGKVGRDFNDRVKGDYKNLSSNDLNWYTKSIQNVKNTFGVNKNPQLQDLFAKVENVAGIIINDRYGAAVTETEMSRAREYIAMSGNTLSDMKIKLRNFAEFSAEQNRYDLDSSGLNIPELVKDFDLGMPLVDNDKNSGATQDSPDDAALREMQMEIDQDAIDLGPVSYDGKDILKTTIGGRTVAMKREPLLAFKMANQEFKQEYGTDIIVGSNATATFRSQVDTIKSMAERAGIEFNESNPNATASLLRANGYQVADVGKSKHEKGEAVDLYPSSITIAGQSIPPSQYIELVKPYLEKYGFAQASYGGKDPGNFEFSQSNIYG